MKEKKITLITILKAIILLFKRNSLFTKNQFKYLVIKYINLYILKNYEYKMRKRTLEALVDLKKTPKDRYYLLDDIKFCRMRDDLFESLIGMFLDIFLKDYFYKLNSINRINYKDDILFYFYQEGPYEIDNVQIKNGDVVIDAGANIGVFSILAAKKGAYVYAFEPQSLFFNYLNKNIELNKLNSKIETYKFAISNKNHQEYLSINHENLPAASIIIDRGGYKYKVNCISIDNWVDQKKINEINFIKADIEGAERLLIDGAKKSLIRFKPKLALSTYHFPDDKEIIKEKILTINPHYKIIQTRKILFAF